MSEILRTYREWETIIESEDDWKIYDSDGLRAIIYDGKDDLLMTKEEAMNYFVLNTMMWGPKSSMRISNMFFETSD